MDINELESFKLSDAVKFHNELNPKIFSDYKMDPEVREQLMLIAKDFITYLGIGLPKIEDITISGSNAAYSYTDKSDLDLHILVDMTQLSNDEVYRELFDAKKKLYNDEHEITVRGIPVELYVQDSNQKHFSLGEYSVLKNDWIKMPTKRRANFDQIATRLKYEKLSDLIDTALQTQDQDRLDKVLDIIKRYRQAGLSHGGEFSPENLAYKAARSQGAIKALYDLKNKLHSEKLSIDEILDKDSAAKNIYWSKEDVELDFYNDKKYTVHTAATQDKNKNILKYNFYNFPNYDLTAIEFSRAVGRGEDDFDIDNAGDQYTVFATLLETIKQYLSDERPEYILFGAKEPGRVKLYQTFVDRFASKFGYKQVSANSIPKPVTSVILSSDDTPFLLQKTGTVKEASGYIPSAKEKNDPRFKTALTVDVTPNSIKKNAKAFGWKISRAGKPPLLRK